MVGLGFVPGFDVAQGQNKQLWPSISWGFYRALR